MCLFMTIPNGIIRTDSLSDINTANESTGDLLCRAFPISPRVFGGVEIEIILLSQPNEERAVATVSQARFPASHQIR
jgi:hypothetical protein